MKRLFTRFGSLDDHLKELLCGATTAASLKIVAALATFGLHLMLGRMLGPEGSGIYFLAFTIVTIAATLARFGLDNTLVRFVAAGEATNHPERVRGVYRLGVWITAVVSCALGGLLYASASWFATSVFKDGALATSLQIMALAVPPFALFVIHAQALQGLKRIRDSIATLSVIAPALTAMLSIVLIPLFGVPGAASAYVIAAIVTLFFGAKCWKKWTRHCIDKEPLFSLHELLGSSVPLFLVAVMNLMITWMSTIMLGLFSSSHDVGLFSAANRTAMLISFVLVAINSIAAPQFAALYQQGDLKELKRLAKHSTRVMIVVAAPVLIIFMAGAKHIMGLFGEQFHDAAPLLQILAAGQFINVATGSVGFVLMMTGNEKSMSCVLFVSGAICLMLNLILVSALHSVGAAIATAVTVSTQNILALILVRKRLGA